jgi:hypothetical protein
MMRKEPKPALRRKSSWRVQSDWLNGAAEKARGSEPAPPCGEAPVTGKRSLQERMKNISKPIEITMEAKVMSGVRNADQRWRRRSRFISSMNSGGGGCSLLFFAAAIKSAEPVLL